MWLYKDEPKSQVVKKCDAKILNIPSKSYGLGDKLITKMGYTGKGPLGL